MLIDWSSNQNQRQKARRPSSQSQPGALLTRPAQFGSYPNVQIAALDRRVQEGEIGTAGMSTRVQNLPPTTASASAEQALRHHSYHPSESHLDRGSQLLGPGMPGSEPPLGESFRGRDLPLPAPSTSVWFAHHPAATYSLPMEYPASHTTGYITPRPSSVQVGGAHMQQRTFSRTLPPLVFDVPRHRSSFSAPGPNYSYFATAGPSSSAVPFDGRYSSSPEQPFAHHSPRIPMRHPSTFTPIPPPPPPRWDVPSPPQRFSRSSPPLVSSPALTASSTRERPVRSHREHSRSISPPSHAAAPEDTVAESPAPTRIGRYDPVRAAFITPEHIASPSGGIGTPTHSAGPAGDGERPRDDDQSRENE
jgi:hypothetical protein